MNSRNPYDRDEVLDACAAHAWKQRQEEFEKHGINSQSELRAHIDQTIENEQTQAFRAHTQSERGHTFGREIYDLPLDENYNTTVVLNPNRNVEGQVYGGTCYIRSNEKGEFSRLQRDEFRASGEEAEVVIGGREALREQEQHRQLDPQPQAEKIPDWKREAIAEAERKQPPPKKSAAPEPSPTPGEEETWSRSR